MVTDIDLFMQRYAMTPQSRDVSTSYLNDDMQPAHFLAKYPLEQTADPALTHAAFGNLFPPSRVLYPLHPKGAMAQW
ncbi:hypothetical protein CVT24_012767 [Panaeolus cyanescens]|uniref:Uncharacterized protein n=1 Tax=Panaeolus cyanescens TaxID=181874 RepID=A0A409YJH4_9AGAR|nr:hypothetical protein CVT24_012767 [Panaeolus cyanescens]